MELGDRDPSELGYKNVTELAYATTHITGSSLMMKKLGSMFG